MKMKVNFKTDEPTVNGHIYPKEVLKKAFEEKFKEPVYVCTENSNLKIEVDKIVGEVKSYEVNESGEILVDIKPLKTPLVELLDDKNVQITTSGMGTFKKDGKTIGSDFILSHFFLTNKENA